MMPTSTIFASVKHTPYAQSGLEFSWWMFPAVVLLAIVLVVMVDRWLDKREATKVSPELLSPSNSDASAAPRPSERA